MQGEITALALNRFGGFQRLGYISEVDVERISAIDVEEALSPKFQLGILKNIEREMPPRKRKATQNWKLVQDYILGHTSHGGSTSCYKHCHFLGIDPEGYTVWEEI